MSTRQKSQLELEADLFASIATLDKLSKFFDKGMVEETIYRKQLNTSIKTVFMTRIQLEKLDFDMDQFVQRESLNDKFPEGVRRLDLVEGSGGNQINYTNLQKLPLKVADFVMHAIELMDLLKLRSVARIDYIMPQLDEIHNITTKVFPNGFEHQAQINSWIEKLKAEIPSTLLSEADCEQLEFDAARWLADFRRKIEELQ